MNQVASPLGIDLPMPAIIGSSVRLSRTVHIPPPKPSADRSQMVEFAGLWASSGVSESANAIQRLIQQQIGKLTPWLVAPTSTSIDVENEVVVLMPPKRERVVTVRVSYAGRAKPLIVLDDMYIETDDNP